MNGPLVSIITPLYNGQEFIGQSIESALAQTYRNFELLIINDGSKDGSYEAVSPYLKDPRLIYIERENGGVGAARNTALARASGKYIAFLDQDDLWTTDKLAVQVPVLEQNPDIALVYSNQDFIGDDNKIIDYPWETGISGYCFREMIEKNWISVLTVLVRKSVIDEVGPFKEDISGTDDYEMWLRVTLKHKIEYIDQILAHYRFHEVNFSKNLFKMTELFLKALTYVLNEHPEAIRIAGGNLVKSRMHKLHHQLGDYYSWQAQDYQSGRDHYFKAILHNPYGLESYPRLLHCMVGREGMIKLKWLMKRISGTLSR